MKKKNYLGFAQMESADIRWIMIRRGINRKDLAAAAGITEKKLQDLLSVRIIPVKEADMLMDALDKLKKRR